MAAGYRDLMRVHGYPWLIGAVFLSRLANSMSQVGVVIYLLERTGSPAVAGAGAAAQLLPGILSGPFVGAWLDRAASRRRVIVATVLARAVLLFAVVAVGELAGAPAAVELVLLAGLGVTFPVATVGFRSVVPVVVPRPLWPQANAADSVSFDAAYVTGPALAGAAVTLVGPAFAIGLQAAMTLVAGAVAARVPEPAGRPRAFEPPLRAVADGVRAVAGHVALRSTVVLMVVSGLGIGCFVLGLPLWAREGLHTSPGAVGWMWAAMSAGSILGGLAYGWRRPAGSDARHVVAFAALSGVPLLAVPAAGSVPVAMAAMFAAGVCTAPFIIAMFGIRQRAVEPHLHGRVFAITVSINAAGAPAGAFLAGLAVGPIGVHRLLYAAGLAQPLAAGAAALVMRRGYAGSRASRTTRSRAMRGQPCARTTSSSADAQSGSNCDPAPRSISSIASTRGNARR
jgi:MFS family permease